MDSGTGVLVTLDDIHSMVLVALRTSPITHPMKALGW
jgi:hypothetical protein